MAKLLDGARKSNVSIHSSLSKQRPKKRSAAALQFSLVAMSLFVMLTAFRITLSLHDKDSAVAYHPANPDNVLLVQPQHNIEEDAPQTETSNIVSDKEEDIATPKITPITMKNTTEVAALDRYIVYRDGGRGQGLGNVERHLVGVSFGA